MSYYDLSGDELRSKMASLMREHEAMQKELWSRKNPGVGNDFMYGYMHQGNLIGFVSITDAAKQAEIDLGPGGQYRVTKVYV